MKKDLKKKNKPKSYKPPVKKAPIKKAPIKKKDFNQPSIPKQKAGFRISGSFNKPATQDIGKAIVNLAGSSLPFISSYLSNNKIVLPALKVD